MKPYELKRFYIYTDGHSFFEYIGRENETFIFSIVDFENGCMYHMNPMFYAYMSRNGIKKLKEYKV